MKLDIGIAIFSGVCTLLGAYWGAAIAGKKALESVKEQITYDREKEEERRNEERQKVVPILNRYINNLHDYLRHLEFLIEEEKTGLNVYEIDLREQANLTMTEILNTTHSLERINNNTLTIELNEKLQLALSLIIKLRMLMDTYVKEIDEENIESRMSNIINRIRKLNEVCEEIKNINK